MLYSPLNEHPVKTPTSDLVVVEGEIDAAEPGTKFLIAPYHVHHSDDEVFYIRTGQLAFEIGDNVIVASSGDAVLVPAGEVHTWWNPTSEPASYLIVMPKRLDALINAIHEQARSPEETAALFHEYDSTFVGWQR